MTYTLQDDGTMDTVLSCDNCGEELRYNPEPPEPDKCRTLHGSAAEIDECDRQREAAAALDWDRVGEARRMAEADHTCIPTGYGPRDYEADRNW